MQIRPITPADEPFLWEMLACAAHESSLDTVRSNPDLSRYIEGWGRAHDAGVIACIGESGQPAGAAWRRLFPAHNPGYGFVDAETPELAIAVRPECQGRGIGGSLLTRLIDEMVGSYGALSLSVRSDNPAVRLYERLGFERVAGSETPNRVGTVSITMLRRL